MTRATSDDSPNESTGSETSEGRPAGADLSLGERARR